MAADWRERSRLRGDGGQRAMSARARSCASESCAVWWWCNGTEYKNEKNESALAWSGARRAAALERKERNARASTAAGSDARPLFARGIPFLSPSPRQRALSSSRGRAPSAAS